MNAMQDIDATVITRQIAAAQLSLWPRIMHGALLAAALVMTVIMVALLLTEPALSLRTAVALTVLAVIGASWAVYALWVLTQRKVLYARQRVIAGWLALVFTAIFTSGAFAIGIVFEEPTGIATGGLGVALVGLATLSLVHARRRLAELLDRRRVLEASQTGNVR